MPLIDSYFKTNWIFNNPHINTIYKTFFYHKTVDFKRKRIHTPDQDFIDIDIASVKSKTVVLAVHGLEGSSYSPYIRSISNYLNQHHIDLVALNLRGCSGSDNLLLSSYHSGKTDDIKTSINYLSNKHNYNNIILLGYSLGGNIVLKYLGEENKNIPSIVKCGIAFSTPCDLKGSSLELNKKHNYFYLQKFLISLKKKAHQKLKTFPDSFLSQESINNCKNFKDYDDLYTAPAHGYKDANDYWEKCSSKQFIKDISIPTLLINALDDTFLSPSCYPIEEAKSNPNFYLETPKKGGHVGFNTSLFHSKNNWSENKALQFINQNIRRKQ